MLGTSLSVKPMEVLELIAQTDFGRVERVWLVDGSVAARKVFAPTERVLQGADLGKLSAARRSTTT